MLLSFHVAGVTVAPLKLTTTLALDGDPKPMPQIVTVSPMGPVFGLTKSIPAALLAVATEPVRQNVVGDD
jgi:hypothetical protein